MHGRPICRLVLRCYGTPWRIPMHLFPMFSSDKRRTISVNLKNHILVILPFRCVSLFRECWRTFNLIHWCAGYDIETTLLRGLIEGLAISREIGFLISHNQLTVRRSATINFSRRAGHEQQDKPKRQQIHSMHDNLQRNVFKTYHTTLADERSRRSG